MGLLSSPLTAYWTWKLRRNARRYPARHLERLGVQHLQRVEMARSVAELVLPPDERLTQLCQMAVDRLHCAASSIQVVTDTGQITKAGVGLGAQGRAMLGHEVPMEFSICVHVVARKRPVVLEDTKADPFLRECLAVPNIGAYVGVPLRYGGHIFGAFAAYGPEPREWSNDDVRALHELAQQVEADVRERAAA
jgi:GAF domain-containing protein